MNTKRSLGFDIKKREPEAGRSSLDPIAEIIDAKVVLAPMSGITDTPFRLMARKFGCRFAFTEMIDVNGIVYNNFKTFRMLDKFPGDSPLGVQIAGADEDKILYAAKICEEKGFRVLDFNAGCPAPKVVKAGKGAALLKDPHKLAGIVRKLVKTLKIPITVKIRSGWDERNKNYMEIAKGAEGEGASAICIHPRSREQMYRSRPDYEIVKAVKEAVRIPVFASGNIFSPEDVSGVLKLTGCDAVYLARGIFGRPWLFRDVYDHLSGAEPEAAPTFQEIKKIMIEHFRLCLLFYEEGRVRSKMYKHVCWYLKKYKRLNETMKEYCRVKDFDDFLLFIKGLTLDGRNLAHEKDYSGISI